MRGAQFLALVFLAAVLAGSGCQKAYYTVWESLGKEKRHLLRDQVQETRDAQEESAEAFKDVLTRVRELYGFSGGELETFYERLKQDRDACRGRAEALDDRIERVRRTAGDLFAEWEAEIDQIKSTRFRSQSRASLDRTRRRFQRFETAMMRSRSGMDPVLGQLNDYVLYLKHNLNAQAVGALKQEMADIENDVEGLIGDIRRSIQEAETFLETFE